MLWVASNRELVGPEGPDSLARRLCCSPARFWACALSQQLTTALLGELVVWIEVWIGAEKGAAGLPGLSPEGPDSLARHLCCTLIMLCMQAGCWAPASACLLLVPTGVFPANMCDKVLNVVKHAFCPACFGLHACVCIVMMPTPEPDV